MSVELARDDATSYLRVLEDAGLNTFPRRVGSPGQTTVGSYASFTSWWDQNNGHGRPLFIGHSQIEIPSRGSTLLYRTDAAKFVFETAFGDMDSGDGQDLPPEEVWSEVRKVEAFLTQNRLEHYWKFSGSLGRKGKDEDFPCGFHVHVFFRKETHPREYLERWESAFWRGLKAEFQIRSINGKCANPVCLERLPFSQYVHKKDGKEGYKPESNFCVPIPYRWIAEGNLDRIRDATRFPGDLYNAVYGPSGPGTVRYISSDPRPTLEGFVRRKGWEGFGHESYALHPSLGFVPNGSVADLVRLYIPDRSCLRDLPFGSNPRHVIRFALLCELISLGMGSEEAISLITGIGQEARWEDFNPPVIRQQVQNAFSTRGGAGYKPMSCRKLREGGACLGPSCSLFRDSFPADWKAWKQNHPEVGA